MISTFAIKFRYVNSTTRKDIKLLDEKGKNVCDPNKIAELLNKYFASVGNNIDKKIPRSLKHFKDFMTKIKVNKTGLYPSGNI